jgi:DGQHR domain-containing protein
MSKLTGINEIVLMAVETKNLDTICYRGSAPLAQLAMLSQADVFDQDANPKGLQRDLSPKHASEAYEYCHRPVDSEHPRAYPEVVINVRDKKVVEIEEVESAGEDRLRQVRIRFFLEKMRGPDKVSVSRVDGNHRLFYVAGDEHRDPVLAEGPFQIQVGLTQEQEASLFVDINSNQKGLNSSHLDILKHRLTPEETEIKDHPERWIAKKLTDDAASPWHGLIHEGGAKKGARTQGLTRPVNFASIETGVARTLAKSQYIDDLTRIEAQYGVIRNYWAAVKSVFSKEWADVKNYLLLKNIGVLSLSILGGTIVDRCIPRGTVSPEDMSYYLRQARDVFDWQKDASGDRSLAGMSGNRAALIIAGQMAAQLSDRSGTSVIRDLEEKLIQQSSGAGGEGASAGPQLSADIAGAVAR